MSTVFDIHTIASNYVVADMTPGCVQREIAEPFIVPTPRAYVVDLSHYASPEKKVETTKRLLKKVEGLIAVLQMLGISYQVAFEKNYTLNLRSREALSSLALSARNYDAVEAIRALDL